jgi:oligoribonuclease NrnB/cAMP/cGMP phosphodiesterase (DHH superfamily)
MKKIVVLYHNDCHDGFGGAWAAWKKFRKRADYIPALHQTSPDPKLRDKEIYLIDFTYSGKNLETLVGRNTQVIIIDHHATAKSELKTATGYLFDLNHSGATLAWKFFHSGTKVPTLLRYIEDNDLWKFALPHTKELSASLELEPFSLRRWDTLAREFENVKSRAIHIKKGKTILAYEDKTVRELALKTEPALFQGRRAGVINSPILQSQLGNAIYEKLRYPIAIVWSRQKGGIRVSLRSKKNSKVDVAKLAQKYGGGGHKAAAGFKFSAVKPLPWKYLKRS